MIEQEEKEHRKEHDREIRENIGKFIQRSRKAKHMTQEDLVEKVGRGLSVNSLSRYETGAVEMGIVTYFEIVSALGIAAAIDTVTKKLLQDSVPLHTPEGYEKLSDDRKYIVDQIISSLLYQQMNQH